MLAPRFEQILGIRFINGSPLEATQYIEDRGGYVVVPAAPALANITRDFHYRRALLEADLAIADSGFMVLLWLAFRGKRIRRISGLEYTQELLRDRVGVAGGAPFFVLPSQGAREKALKWLYSQRIGARESDTYIAPIYPNEVADPELLGILNRSRPKQIIVAIGGGAQEKLAYFLRQHLDYRPAIHCIGAALGFLTGHQKSIPAWADRFYLGWLLRIVRQPTVFIPRFWSARRLPWLIWRYRDRLPPVEK